MSEIYFVSIMVNNGDKKVQINTLLIIDGLIVTVIHAKKIFMTII